MKPTKTAEEVLRDIQELAAMLQHHAFSAALDCSELPTEYVWNGIGEVCRSIDRKAEHVRKALSVDCLNTNVRGEE
jgi:hypothetical protein